ncbi:hypothetical protein [uncultured Roseivirga sp.]|uniref:hypothetical protein n=1 Tax=uncultured Roseivirga sp. TaxID=543088 RepID=UPI0030D82330|tara:strand:- start:112871 stop:113527 length:657 start_codon:yes stop_codon:yes gene_type:complete
MKSSSIKPQPLLNQHAVSSQKIKQVNKADHSCRIGNFSIEDQNLAESASSTKTIQNEARTVAVLIFIVTAICFQNFSFAQTSTGTANKSSNVLTSTFIQKTGVPMIEALEKEGLSVVRFEMDGIVSSRVSWRNLTKGFKYGFVAFSDHRVKDIDIKISKYKDGKWVEVVKDSKAETWAIASVTPLESEEYKIEISVYQYSEGYDSADYGLVVTLSKLN